MLRTGQASLITGLSMETGAFADPTGRLSHNLVEYHQSARERDAYVAYAVLPNSMFDGARSGQRVGGTGLRVIREDNNGVVVSGVKALATAAVLADEIWIGNLQPIGDQESEAITYKRRRRCQNTD